MRGGLPHATDALRLDEHTTDVRGDAVSGGSSRAKRTAFARDCAGRSLAHLRRARVSLALALPLALQACVTLDRESPRTPSVSLTSEEAAATTFGRRWAEDAPADPALSAFRLFPSGLEALAARVALIDGAERTLDLQYYIFAEDDVGLFLVDRLVSAADRGVRVRILIDDMYTHGTEAGLIAFDAHPNIELRLFNPWTRREGGLGAGFEFLLTPRLNHRMHNKLFIGDGTVAIFGGRNLADEYFDLHDDFEFKDLDVGAVGPVVAAANALFDDFWNGPDAIPVIGIDPPPDASEALANGRARLAAHRDRMQASAYADAVRDTEYVRGVLTRSVHWTHARGRVLADAPEKTTRADDPLWTDSLGVAAGEVVFGAERELLASSPYFVPRAKGTARLSALAARGVEVTILTNSLAANDVGLVHAGYAKYRARLVRDGVRLYELRRRAADEDRVDDGRAFGSANASLHAKTFVVDRERVFIGSLNLDPRSIALNTEVGVLIESRELAESVARMIQHLTRPELSYRLAIGPLGELLWIGQDRDGKEIVLRQDPDTSAWKRISNGFLGLLPIEGQI